MAASCPHLGRAFYLVYWYVQHWWHRITAGTVAVAVPQYFYKENI